MSHSLKYYSLQKIFLFNASKKIDACVLTGLDIIDLLFLELWDLPLGGRDGT